MKSTPRPPDRENIPTIKHPRPPSYTIDNDDIQEIVPVKSEPSDPIMPAVAVAPPVDNYSQPPTHALAQEDDQDMVMTYQEEGYEDYGQYEAEQEYVGSVDIANKGRDNVNP